MNRTDEYESKLRAVETLSNQAIAAKTISRAFADYAVLIGEIPTRGALADFARDDLIETATERAAKWAKIGVAKDKTAQEITVEMGS